MPDFEPKRLAALSLLLPLLVAGQPQDALAQEASAMAQEHSAHAAGPAVMSELMAGLEQVEGKIMALAETFDQATYDWRPAEGVRSSGEVFMHIAFANYLFPLMGGTEAPAAIGMSPENMFEAAGRLEAVTQQGEVLPQVRTSFEHLRNAMAGTSEADLEREVDLFGNMTTMRAMWIAAVGHLQEHLGQLIAYGRTNGVVPPWSQ